jgi:hypothetical protein
MKLDRKWHPVIIDKKDDETADLLPKGGCLYGFLQLKINEHIDFKNLNIKL